jgi:hypothetical protein
VEFEVGTAGHGFAIGIEGDRIIAADGKAGVPIHHDPFRRCRLRRQRQRSKNTQKAADGRMAGSVLFPLLPCCGHSFSERLADSLVPEKKAKPRLSRVHVSKGLIWGRSMNPAARFAIVSLTFAGLSALLVAWLVAIPGTTPAGAQTMPPPQPPSTVGPAASPPPPPPSNNHFSPNEVIDAGHHFFGGVSRGLASIVEKAGNQWGQPNGYILGEEASGAFVGGLRYGDGTLYTKNAGDVRVYWQGPSLGFDAGADGARTMMLVYNLPRTEAIFERFGGVAGSAYFIGGLGMTALTANDIVVVPIRTGVGLRLGANLGYLKFTSRPTWNPF